MNMCFKKCIVNFFTLLEWILFFGLLYCSIICAWDVFEKYNSKDTIFVQNEVKSVLLPVITICFSETEVNWKFHQDFNITYYCDSDKIKNFDIRPIHTLKRGVCYQLNANHESVQNKLHQIREGVSFLRVVVHDF